jgi:hypothetical protein
MVIIKSFNPLSSDRWLFWLQHLKTTPSIFAQMILDKLKRCMTIATSGYKISGKCHAS